MGSALDQLAAQARSALNGDLPSVEPGSFVGASPDGLIRAEAEFDGTLRTLTIDPSAFGAPLEDILAAARLAINQALNARPGQGDYSAVIGEVRAAQDQARQELGAVLQGIAQVTQDVRSARGGER
jgi:hypothetical protein